MSDHGASEHGNSAHAHDDGGVHVHVHSWKLYAAILGALLFLTVVTVVSSEIDIDRMLALGGEVQGVGAWNMTLAILIATTKASLVVLFFMHLKDDSRFNALIFVGSVLFVGVFLAYTMNDTSVRGTMDRYNGVQVDPDTGLRASGGVEGRIAGEVLLPGLTAPEEPPAAAAGGEAEHEAAPAAAPAGDAADEADEAAPEASAEEATAEPEAAPEEQAGEEPAEETGEEVAAEEEAAAPEEPEAAAAE